VRPDRQSAQKRCEPRCQGKKNGGISGREGAVPVDLQEGKVNSSSRELTGGKKKESGGGGSVGQKHLEEKNGRGVFGLTIGEERGKLWSKGGKKKKRRGYIEGGLLDPGGLNYVDTRSLVCSNRGRLSQTEVTGQGPVGVIYRTTKGRGEGGED